MPRLVQQYKNRNSELCPILFTGQRSITRDVEYRPVLSSAVTLGVGSLLATSQMRNRFIHRQQNNRMCIILSSKKEDFEKAGERARERG